MTTLKDSTEFEIIEKFLLRSDSIIEEQTIPLYDIEAVAGVVELFVDNHIPIEDITIPNMPKCDGAVYVIGDSMTPLLNTGDIVLYKTTESRRGGLFFGEMYLLAFEDEGEEFVCIKYVHQSDTRGYYRLESENPRHKPREVPADNVRMMALIKGSIRYSEVR